ncbi:MAG: hypothetical protein A2W23_06015 [Planctomycetes bacterium RBG_16_43_13]|nr:MAG: hypothetical protein A2W23_06015 [Planctomycetes bacterium RBG_16_43_13]
MLEKPQNDQPAFSFRQINKFVGKLHLRDGDVLALKYGTNIAQKDFIDKLTNAIVTAGHLNVIIIVVDSFDDLNVLDQETMNKMGWFRKEQLLKVLPKR